MEFEVSLSCWGRDVLWATGGTGLEPQEKNPLYVGLGELSTRDWWLNPCGEMRLKTLAAIREHCRLDSLNSRNLFLAVWRLGRSDVWKWPTCWFADSRLVVSSHGEKREQTRFVLFLSEHSSWDFPGGPVAKTPCSQCRGPGFDPWSGNKIPHVLTPQLKILSAATKTLSSQIN